MTRLFMLSRESGMERATALGPASWKLHHGKRNLEPLLQTEVEQQEI